ncbi:MAG: M24 family metallopeptidase [Halobacteria archaeon]
MNSTENEGNSYPGVPVTRDRYSELDRLVNEGGYDAYLTIADGSDSNMVYLSGFEAPDPYVYLRIPDVSGPDDPGLSSEESGVSVLLVSVLERGRAEKEASVDKVRGTSEFVDGDIRGDPDAKYEVWSRLLSEYGVDEVAVPGDFGLRRHDELEERGFTVDAVDDVIGESRAVKTREEVEELRGVQQLNEEVLNMAEEMLVNAEVLSVDDVESMGSDHGLPKDGEVLYLDGEPLTAERVRNEIKVGWLRRGCSPEEPIVACGPRGADPHWRGEGVLRADEPIILDLFPEGPSGYYGDMTRTWVKGSADGEVLEMYDAVQESLSAGLDSVEAGVEAEYVHGTVCDVLEDGGYKTERMGDIDEGFIHSTGHGVGMDLHEKPRLGSGGGELKSGMVVTVEPGLYLKDLGGLRIEDMVVVTDDGYRNLNSYHKDLEI